MMKKNIALKLILTCSAVLLVIPVIIAQDVQSDLLGRINGLRASLGRTPYTLNGALSAAAANQANWMATTREISHVQYDGSRPRDRAVAAGYGSTWVSENIYIGSDASPSNAWTFWINSPVHYAGLTNTNYQEVGIASAPTGDGWYAFVLVFGNPGGAPPIQASTGGNSSGQSSAPSGPPPWVVGVDPVGNIMHEVRQDDTWGDILLEYGYTWDDLERVLALNGREFNDEGVRSIKPGDVVLVPPYEGTYTPTPEGAPADAQATQPAENADEQAVEAMTVNNPEGSSEDAPSEGTPPEASEVPSEQPSSSEDLGIIDLSPTPTLTPTLTPTTTPMPSMPTNATGADIDTGTPTTEMMPTAAEEVAAAVTSGPIMTATPQEIMVRTLPARTLVPTMQVNIQQSATIPTANADDDAPPAWLIAAIVAQVIILGFAGFQLIRQRRG